MINAAPAAYVERHVYICLSLARSAADSPIDRKSRFSARPSALFALRLRTALRTNFARFPAEVISPEQSAADIVRQHCHERGAVVEV